MNNASLLDYNCEAVLHMFESKRIAIDFDGSFDAVTNNIEAFSSHIPLAPKSGAAKTANWLETLGFKLSIFTCRPDYHCAYTEEQFSEGEITIFDEACIYKRGEYWKSRMWLPKENRYARKRGSLAEVRAGR